MRKPVLPAPSGGFTVGFSAVPDPKTTGQRFTGSGQPFFWTGRVAIGLLHKPRPSVRPSDVTVQELLLRGGAKPLVVIQALVLLDVLSNRSSRA